MQNKLFKVQKIICIFFITFLCFITGNSIIYASDEDYTPNSEVTANGKYTHLVEHGMHGYVTSHYILKLVPNSFSHVKNTARYEITSYYSASGYIKLYGDSVWINDTHVGDFNWGNGTYEDAPSEIWRADKYGNKEKLYATLKSGNNYFETRNIGGSGGESGQKITIRQFATPPQVIGKNGIWYEGEVDSGLRTWESLYTDGATGTQAGNKKQTATGFWYYDYDEANPAIDAYTPENAVSDNGHITRIVDQNGNVYNDKTWKVMNNVGTYTIYSKTKDSGGLESKEVARVVTVKARNYSLSYDGNGATSGSTTSQTCQILHNCTLNNNGFSRAFNVSFNGNGGSPTKGNEVANATFLGWQDHNNFSYKGIVYPSYVFNFPYYANTPGDIRNAFGYDKEAGINHWLSTSINNSYENRQSSPEFSISHYMAYGGQDLKNAFGSNRPAFVNHFIHNGYYEGRNAAPAVTGNLNDTYPNRAVVRNLSLDDGARLTLRAKWKDGQVTLPSGNRTGYKIIGWYTSPTGGSKIGNVGDKYTPSKNTTIYAHWDKAPEIIASDKTFYEGEYSHDEWINTVRMKDITASDLEDGDISSKIKVAYDNVNVNVPGEYKVTYQVTDSVGQTVYKDIKVTVLYNNPPTITAEDRWFYVSEDVTNERLMERVKAEDIEDGDITDKAIIISNSVENHRKGEYEVTYEITDAYGKQAEITVRVYIVDDVAKGDDKITYIRFIDKEYINTLQENSEWRTPQRELELLQTLEKNEDLEAEQIWKLSSEDIIKIQAFNAAYDYSSESNQEFLKQFQHLIK